MPTDDWERGYAAGFAAGHSHGIGRPYTEPSVDEKRMKEARLRDAPKKKRKASAYSKKYGAAFKKIAPKYKTKSGSWRKGGFKAAQKAAHKMARK